MTYCSYDVEARALLTTWFVIGMYERDKTAAFETFRKDLPAIGSVNMRRSEFVPDLLPSQGKTTIDPKQDS